VFDHQAGPGQHPAEVRGREAGHPLDPRVRVLAFDMLHGDALEEVRGCRPPRDAEARRVHGHRLVADAMRVGVGGIEVIEHQRPARRQGARDVVQDPDVLALAVEVAEAGEQVQDDLVAFGPEGSAHVVAAETEAPGGVRASLRDAVGRQVEAGDVETKRGDAPRVSSGPAAEVEDPGRRRRPEPPDQPVHETLGFGQVAAGIQPVVLG